LERIGTTSVVGETNLTNLSGVGTLELVGTPLLTQVGTTWNIGISQVRTIAIGGTALIGTPSDAGTT
jgi:hypothetical protein